jgi:DNA-binding MarR family transcriptional regulator
MLANMRRAGRHMSAATIMFHQAIADRLGLNPTDHKCVDLLSLTADPMTAGDLADLTGLTTGAITGVIDRLEKAGYVKREEDPSDRRRVILRIIPQRLCEAGKMFMSLAASMAQLGSRYSDRDLATILDFMTRSSQVLREETLKLRSEATPTARRKLRNGRRRTGGARKSPHPPAG